MPVLRIDQSSPYHQLIGVGGIGTGIFFELEGNATLGRNESRPSRLLGVRDYCKLHIVIHYVAKRVSTRAWSTPRRSTQLYSVSASNIQTVPAATSPLATPLRRH